MRSYPDHQPGQGTPSCPGGAGGRGSPGAEGTGARGTAGRGTVAPLQDPDDRAKVLLPRSEGSGAPPGQAAAAPQPALHRPKAPEPLRPGGPRGVVPLRSQ